MAALTNPRREAYARRRAAAIVTFESCIASVRTLFPNLTPISAEHRVKAWNKRPDIAARIAELQRSGERTAVAMIARTSADMQISEAVADLVLAWKTPVGDVDEHHQLAQEVTRDTYTTGTGKRAVVHTRTKVKSVGKIDAITLLAKMKGWTQEAAVSISFPGFVATVRDVTPIMPAIEAQASPA